MPWTTEGLAWRGENSPQAQSGRERWTDRQAAEDTEAPRTVASRYGWGRVLRRRPGDGWSCAIRMGLGDDGFSACRLRRVTGGKENLFLLLPSDQAGVRLGATWRSGE